MNYLEEAKDIRDELRFHGNSWNRQRIIQKAQRLKSEIEIKQEKYSIFGMGVSEQYMENMKAIKELESFLK